MQATASQWSRRQFLASAAAGALAATTGAASESRTRRNLQLGFDNFSIRAWDWKASQLLEYAGSLQVDVVMFSDLNVYESHEPAYLKKIRSEADERGLQIHVGTGCVCPTSNRFVDAWGTAEEHLALTIRIAAALGSPVVRCFLGNAADRRGDGGIARHIESLMHVCKAVKNRAVDAGVKIAIENHAGDLQARELKALIEEAGQDYVGATLDSGNATWTLEDPLENLRILGPYAATTGMRDSAVWRSPRGAFVEWTNIGDGHVDWSAYLDQFEQLCPRTPFVLETISMIGPREFPDWEPSFWEAYPEARAREFARFAAMAERGEKFVPPAGRPRGAKSQDLAKAQQKFDLEASIRHCQTKLGLGPAG